MTKTIQLEATIPETSHGKRLDQTLAELFPEHSRSRIQAWIKAQKVSVDGKHLRPKDKVLGGEHISINAEVEPQEEWHAEAIPLNIIYEDEELLIINKPIDLVVHPAAGNREGTLLNALIHHDANLADIPRAGIVHRLDKDTSGIMVVAKTLTAHTYLVAQLQARMIAREYEAIVSGVMTAGGKIDEPIGRHPTQRTKMAVIGSGKHAITHYRVAEKYRAHTRVSIKLETGRTHQIRVHLAYIHYPIVGDNAYAGRLKIPKGASAELIASLHAFKHQALHAHRLTLIHPTTATEMTWTAPLPEDMMQLIHVLREDNANVHQT